MVFQTVKDNLWKLYPPEPASEEEQALEAKEKEAQQLEKDREKVLSASHMHCMLSSHLQTTQHKTATVSGTVPTRKACLTQATV